MRYTYGISRLITFKMNYNVKGTGLQITDEIRDYVEKRFGHVDKFLKDDTTAHADVELEFKAGEEHKKFRAEFTLTARKQVYRVEARGDTLHEAIDVATAELTQEVTREKKKHQHLLRRGAATIKDVVRGLRDK